MTVNAFERAGGGVMNIDLSPSPFRIKSNLKTDPLKIKTRIMIIYYYRMTKKSFFEKKADLKTQPQLGKALLFIGKLVYLV